MLAIIINLSVLCRRVDPKATISFLHEKYQRWIQGKPWAPGRCRVPSPNRHECSGLNVFESQGLMKLKKVIKETVWKIFPACGSNVGESAQEMSHNTAIKF
jgi:hypothetical protein